MRKKYLILIVIVIIAIVSFIVVTQFYAANDQSQQKRTVQPSQIVTDAGVTVESPYIAPNFEEIALDAPHSYDKSSYAFRGSALIDVNDDGVDELWLAGEKGQRDSLFKFDNGSFSEIGSQAGLQVPSSASAGAISLDIDTDGDTDLIIAREDGIYIATNSDRIFSESKIEISLPGGAIPFSVSATDYNKDGWADLYISTFIAFDQFQSATFNKQSNRSQNVMLRNNGDNTFTDVTQESGLAFDQNTFQVSFVDLDNDMWQDMIIAANTSEVFVYRNKQNGTFEKSQALSGFGFWMGLAVADYDNDGDQDFFVSNAGSTIPERVGRGDLRGNQQFDGSWRLYRNDGNFNFTDVAVQEGVTEQRFGWGAMFADVNNDGLQDLAVSENYIKWPPHKLKKLSGSFLMRQGSQFQRDEKNIGAQNSFYGTTPLFSDFNQDGYLDLVYVNMDSSTRVLLNQTSGNNFVAVHVPDTAAMIGAVVKLTFSNGDQLVQEKVVGQGLMSDGTSEVIFGLGARIDVVGVEITNSKGEITLMEDIKINQRASL